MGRGDAETVELAAPERLAADTFDPERPRLQVYRVLAKTLNPQPGAMNFHLVAKAWHEELADHLAGGYRWRLYDGNDYGGGERIDVRVRAESREEALREVLRVTSELQLPLLDKASPLIVPLGVKV